MNDLKKAFDDDKDTFEWCGYQWKCSMEGGRIIHSDFPWYWMDKHRVLIEDNEIIGLYLVDDEKQINYWDGKTYNPTKACGTMRSIESFSYGTFSADIKSPHGYNLWPSFWLSGEGNWPPEIDIYEAWSYNDNYFKLFKPQFPYLSPGWKTTNNVHYLNNDLSKNDSGSHNISIFKNWKKPQNHFINYKVEWFPNEITFYVDGKKIRKIKKDTCLKLVKNLNKPEKGFNMNVIFNVWCENPENFNVEMITPMKIKNFIYIPYKNK